MRIIKIESIKVSKTGNWSFQNYVITSLETVQALNFSSIDWPVEIQLNPEYSH